jgi:hypothetical protein
MNSGLFDEEFALADAANAATQARQKQTQRSAAIARKASALVLRRATSEAELARLLPPILAQETSYHIMSSGDIDALSYLRHIVTGMPIDRLTLSTWCMNLDDAQWLFAMQDAGKLDQIRLYFGEIMPGTYPDVYEYVHAMERAGRCQMTIARNHSKIMLGYNEPNDAAYVIESSANVNTNPRFEQTAIHTSRPLLKFYEEFFAHVQCIDKRQRLAKP